MTLQQLSSVPSSLVDIAIKIKPSIPFAGQISISFKVVYSFCILFFSIIVYPKINIATF